MKISTIRFEPDLKAGLLNKYRCYYRELNYAQSDDAGACDEDWIPLIINDEYFIIDIHYNSIYTLKNIRASLAGTGQYRIFNCSCFIPECEGWDYEGITVNHTETLIEWKIPEKNLEFTFSKEQYKATLDALDKAIQPLLDYDTWAQAPENSADPVLWAISEHKNELLSTLLEGTNIAAGAKFEPDHYRSLEAYSAYATEVGNNDAAILINKRAESLAGAKLYCSGIDNQYAAAKFKDV